MTDTSPQPTVRRHKDGHFGVRDGAVEWAWLTPIDGGFLVDLATDDDPEGYPAGTLLEQSGISTGDPTGRWVACPHHNPFDGQRRFLHRGPAVEWLISERHRHLASRGL